MVLTIRVYKTLNFKKGTEKPDECSLALFLKR